MTLIQCTECGKQIFATNKSCPNCGLPLEFDVKRYMNNKEKRSPNKGTIIIFILATLIIVLLSSYYIPAIIESQNESIWVRNKINKWAEEIKAKQKTNSFLFGVSPIYTARKITIFGVVLPQEAWILGGAIIGVVLFSFYLIREINRDRHSHPREPGKESDEKPKNYFYY